MKPFTILITAAAFGICIAGCRKQTAYERHEITKTRTVESQTNDIALYTTNSNQNNNSNAKPKQSNPKHKRTETTVIIKEPEEIVVE